MNSKYYQDEQIIYHLIRIGDDETLYKEYPEIKKYRRFLDLIIEVYHEVHTYDYEDYFATQVFSWSLMICEKINSKIDDMINNKELVSYIVNNFHQTIFQDLLLVIFNPIVYSINVSHGEYYMYRLCYEYDLDILLEISDEKYRTLLDKIRLIRTEYQDTRYDTTIYVLLLYCHINNNYEYLDNYLADLDCYHDKLLMNNIVDNIEYPHLSDYSKKVFIKVNDIFSKKDRIIK